MSENVMDQEAKKPRTAQQNKALHVLFQHLADALNDAGLDMRKTLKPSVDIPWSGATAKEYLWRPIMKAQLGIDSTTDLSTGDVDKVFETISRYIGQSHGVTIPFPSIDELIFKQQEQADQKKVKRQASTPKIAKLESQLAREEEKFKKLLVRPMDAGRFAARHTQISNKINQLKAQIDALKK